MRWHKTYYIKDVCKTQNRLMRYHIRWGKRKINLREANSFEFPVVEWRLQVKSEKIIIELNTKYVYNWSG